MAARTRKRPVKRTPHEELMSLFKDMFIAQLALAGVAQRNIARAVGVDINRVNRVARELRRDQ